VDERTIFASVSFNNLCRDLNAETGNSLSLELSFGNGRRTPSMSRNITFNVFFVILGMEHTLKCVNLETSFPKAPLAILQIRIQETRERERER